MLQEEISRVPAEGIVDHAQFFDVNDDHGAPDPAVARARPESPDPLAEERTLRKTRMRIEVREKVNRVVLL